MSVGSGVAVAGMWSACAVVAVFADPGAGVVMAFFAMFGTAFVVAVGD